VILRITSMPRRQTDMIADEVIDTVFLAFRRSAAFCDLYYLFLACGSTSASECMAISDSI